MSAIMNRIDIRSPIDRYARFLPALKDKKPLSFDLRETELYRASCYRMLLKAGANSSDGHHKRSHYRGDLFFVS